MTVFSQSTDVLLNFVEPFDDLEHRVAITGTRFFRAGHSDKLCPDTLCECLGQFAAMAQRKTFTIGMTPYNLRMHRRRRCRCRESRHVKAFWLRKMARHVADADSPGDADELSAERDLLSLARMLHYTKCEAEALGQTAAAALVDAALLSLNGNARGDRVRGVLADQPTRTQTRKFC